MELLGRLVAVVLLLLVRDRRLRGRGHLHLHLDLAAAGVAVAVLAVPPPPHSPFLSMFFPLLPRFDTFYPGPRMRPSCCGYGIVMLDAQALIVIEAGRRAAVSTGWEGVRED